MTVLIFANGVMDGVAWVRPYLAEATAVIAADGGTGHLQKLNYPPQVVIGDMDSLSEEMQRWLEANQTTFITHPPAKDETDLELALLYAATHYPDDLLLFGALGGRLDQTLANILLLSHPQLHGRTVQLITEQERAWLVTAVSEIHGRAGDTVSLIPLGGDVRVRSASGLAWPLQDETLAFGLARGVSNVMVGDTAVVEVASGTLLCIHTTADG
ncbi:MAG: thiamine diphosphokinase [Chloroflexi bacterium]|nr:thiamine diphosphokinase [Chloroflexota bacterium]